MIQGEQGAGSHRRSQPRRSAAVAARVAATLPRAPSDQACRLCHETQNAHAVTEFQQDCGNGDAGIRTHGNVHRSGFTVTFIAPVLRSRLTDTPTSHFRDSSNSLFLIGDAD